MVLVVVVEMALDSTLKVDRADMTTTEAQAMAARVAISSLTVETVETGSMPETAGLFTSMQAAVAQEQTLETAAGSMLSAEVQDRIRAIPQQAGDLKLSAVQVQAQQLPVQTVAMLAISFLREVLAAQQPGERQALAQ